MNIASKKFKRSIAIEEEPKNPISISSQESTSQSAETPEATMSQSVISESGSLCENDDNNSNKNSLDSTNRDITRHNDSIAKPHPYFFACNQYYLPDTINDMGKYNIYVDYKIDKEEQLNYIYQQLMTQSKHKYPHLDIRKAWHILKVFITSAKLQVRHLDDNIEAWLLPDYILKEYKDIDLPPFLNNFSNRKCFLNECNSWERFNETILEIALFYKTNGEENIDIIMKTINHCAITVALRHRELAIMVLDYERIKNTLDQIDWLWENGIYLSYNERIGKYIIDKVLCDKCLDGFNPYYDSNMSEDEAQVFPQKKIECFREQG